MPPRTPLREAILDAFHKSRDREWTPTARIVSVIEVRYRRGAGVPSDPVRIVTAYYSAEGDRLAESDPEGAEA